jgi:hypothetical protein
MRKQNLKTIIVSVVILIVLLPCVMSIGLAPSKRVLDFLPNLEKTFTGIVINNDGLDASVELDEYDPLNILTIDQNLFQLSKDKKEYHFKYKVNLPQELSESGDLAKIILRTGTSDAGVSSVIIIESIIHVNLPLPEVGRQDVRQSFVDDISIGDDTDSEDRNGPVSKVSDFVILSAPSDLDNQSKSYLGNLDVESMILIISGTVIAILLLISYIRDKRKKEREEIFY